MLDIEHTEATIYPGNYTAFATQKAETQKTLSRKYEHQQKEIARIEGIIAKQRHFGQERNFITIASKQKQIEHMEKIDAPKAAPKNIKMSFRSAGESGNEVIVCENIEKSFGAKKVLSDLSFLVRRGDRVVVIGPNGWCGDSSMCAAGYELLLLSLELYEGGNETPDTGDVGFAAVIVLSVALLAVVVIKKKAFAA